MGRVMIQNYTCKNPITMIGFEAGICWGADTADEKKNYRRGLDCLESGHGRTFEFPDVYLTLEGYSARVIREWYTHIGGQPTRLQASTRYINYEHGFLWFSKKRSKSCISCMDFMRQPAAKMCTAGVGVKRSRHFLLPRGACVPCFRSGSRMNCRVDKSGQNPAPYR